MRLAQLARKLAVRQADITAFLERNNINAEKGSNFRLDDQTVALVLKQFGQTPDPVHDANPYAGPDNKGMDIHDQPLQEDIADPAIETDGTVDPEESMELIKAPKLELPGLRVLGKIDLPGPRPKIQEEDDSNAETTNAAPERSPAPRKKRRMNTSAGTRKNPVTLQREREAREEEKRRRAEEELEKERRRQKYLNKVKINIPTKPARIYDEEVEELQQEVAEEQKPALWGRFVGWLFRKY